MKVIEWMPMVCRFVWSRERQAFASTSEMRRWCRNKAVVINGKRVAENEEMTFPVREFVLFPNHPVTFQ